jgi:hypothetical protein
LAVRETLIDLDRFSGPLPGQANRSNNVGFRERPASVLAPANLGRGLMLEADQKHLSASVGNMKRKRRDIGPLLGYLIKKSVCRADRTNNPAT